MLPLIIILLINKVIKALKYCSRESTGIEGCCKRHLIAVVKDQADRKGFEHSRHQHSQTQCLPVKYFQKLWFKSMFRQLKQSWQWTLPEALLHKCLSKAKEEACLYSTLMGKIKVKKKEALTLDTNCGTFKTLLNLSDQAEWKRSKQYLCLLLGWEHQGYIFCTTSVYLSHGKVTIAKL